MTIVGKIEGSKMDAVAKHYGKIFQFLRDSFHAHADVMENYIPDLQYTSSISLLSLKVLI